MADDNDKSPLTRRRVLGGMATIGAAGAVGAGSWAAFKDEESGSATITAGRLNLKVSGGNIPQGNSFEVSKVYPGDSGSVDFDLPNTGTMEGTLSIEFSSATSKENGRNEPEGEVDSSGDDGELYDKLKLTASNGSSSFGPFNLSSVDGNSYDTRIDLGSGNSKNVSIGYKVPQGAGNEIQSDSTSFDVTFTLKST